MTRETEAVEANTLAQRIIRAPLVSDAGRASANLAELTERVAEEPDAAALLPLLQQAGPFRDLMLALADHSPFLWRLALSDPVRLARLATTVPEVTHAGIVHRQAEQFRRLATEGGDGVFRALRNERAEEALLVALADLGGVWSVDDVIRSLSEFADASVKGAVRTALSELAGEGRMFLPDADDPEAGCGVVFLALGKHGAGELNYSSDIDLVVFFDPECRPIAGKSDPATIYARLAQRVAKLLQDRTAFGFVHRVDYRLRPDPGSMPVAVSVRSAYAYYESVGQNWERAALIKARPIAGDIGIGERLLADLTPFIWRKYFDFASIADVHAMKRQIHAVRGHAEIAVAGHDIKLGRGGIREIEFFVQTQQLVFGGRRPALRGRRTLDMLCALNEEGWINDKACDELSASYRFLRTVEHRLQMIADEQTQRLPADDEELQRFARFCGFPTVKAFGKELTAQARKVQRHYARLFEEGAELATDAGSLVFTGVTDDPETLATLRRMGFQHPETTAETVRGWHFGRRPAITSARAREVLTEVTPALLAALGGSADPDAALVALDKAFGRMPAAVELLTILQSHESLRLQFADLLGTAPRLAEIVAAAPHVLDTVIDPAFADPVTEAEVLEKQIRDMTGIPAHFEDRLDSMRDIVRQMTFLTGARMLSGILSPAQAGEAYSGIAQAAVRVLLEGVKQEFEQDFGTVSGGKVAVLGLGRLGARQLTASSDLDLIVLYDFDKDNRESDGSKPLDAVVYYTRLTQRLIAALTVPTRRGLLYDVDLRLRPQGGKGPVATQFDGFIAYQREEADLWEHMALTRARVIAGDADLSARATQAIAALLSERRDAVKVRTEARAMRALIAESKGDDDPWDLKLAAGGLIDIDFLAQTLVLTGASDHPALIGRDAEGVFREAEAVGLLPSDEAGTLAHAYRQFNDIQQWQRMAVAGSFDVRAIPPAILKRIAMEAGSPSEQALLIELAETRQRVRSIFSSLL